MMLALLMQLPDALPRQTMPARGCAAYLWSTGPERRLVAKAGADPASLRLMLGGRATDLARTGGTTADYGLAGVSEYRGQGASARLEMDVTTRPDISAGALVSAGTLTLERAGADVLVLPVAGLIGCAAPAS